MKAKHIISSVFVLLLCISLTACEKSGEATVTEIEETVTNVQETTVEVIPEETDINDKYNTRIELDNDYILHTITHSTIEGVEFRMNTFSWEIVDYEGKESECVIPSIINNVEVTRVDSNFSGAEMKTLYIPDTVTKIDSGAFANCRNLENIFISDKNKSFIITDNLVLSADGKRVISYYGNKSEVIIPDGVTEIDRQAFMYADITSVKLPDNLEIIGDKAFLGCSALSDVKFPDTLSVIGERAFNGCEQLIEISLKSDGKLQIMDYAFEGCSGIKKIYLENVDFICEAAFHYYDDTEIIISDSLGELEYNAFRGVWDKTITLPDDFGGFKHSGADFSDVTYCYRGQEYSESALAAVLTAPELAEDFDIRMNKLGKIVIVNYKGSDAVVDLRKYKTEVPITELSYSVFKDKSHL